MKKLIRGIVDFRQNVRPNVKERFAFLALGQSPDTLFIACSDSRVVPNLFASSDPGDLFVIRNVGNLIPLCGERGLSTGDEAEGAAIEFALMALPVRDIIVCGHSECGAMKAILRGRDHLAAPNLKAWLRHGETSLHKLEAGERLADGPSESHNTLSQLNVLTQIGHLETYPIVRERIAAGRLRLHGWWFDIREANVYEFERDERRFKLIDEAHAATLLARASEVPG